MAKIEQIKVKDVIYTLGTNAEDISGIIPIDKGGTGLTSSPNLLVNLASTSTDSIFKSSPRPGVTGTLPINRGGTGLTSSPSMLVNLASTTTANVLTASPKPGVTGTLPINRGGTGLTSSPSMLVNLASTTTATVLTASPRPGVTGTLKVANGGTGLATITADAALIGNGTGNIKTRNITNNTDTSTAITGSTNLVTMNTLKNALNRTTSVAAADSNYSTVMARGISLSNTVSTPKNGAILGVYL